MEERKEPLTPEEDPAQAVDPQLPPAPAESGAGGAERPVDSQGRHLVDEDGQPIRWATPGQRVIAWVLAGIVIAITIAFAYAISTGDIFFR